jgi:hypothetical protein
MLQVSHGSDATVDWMTADIAKRCRAALEGLEMGPGSTHQLGNAAMLLRGAADDLVALVELVEGPEAAAEVRSDDQREFDLSFRNASDQHRLD